MDHESAESQPSMAYLIPVVRPVHPPPWFALLERWFQPLLHNRLPNGGSLLAIQLIEEPVVPDCQRGCHFGCIEEMVRIPIFKPGGRQHLLDRSLGIAPIFGEMVGHPEIEDAFQDKSRVTQHPFADHLPLDHRCLHDGLRSLHHVFGDGAQLWIRLDFGSPGLQFIGCQE